jgi:hypothetical protein
MATAIYYCLIGADAVLFAVAISTAYYPVMKMLKAIKIGDRFSDADAMRLSKLMNRILRFTIAFMGTGVATILLKHFAMT